MAGFQDLQTIANDTAFRGRCLYALTVEAIAIMSNSESTVPLVEYAIEVLGGSVNTYQVALTALTNSTIASEATTASLPGCTAVPDSDIQYAVNTYFGYMAGVQAA
jgi:hypothetical protein